MEFHPRATVMQIGDGSDHLKVGAQNIMTAQKTPTRALFIMNIHCHITYV